MAEMIPKRKVCGAIDRAGSDIETCWNALADLRNTNTANAKEIVDIQRRLIAALWLLDDVYRELHAERRWLIGRKERLRLSWFKGRMAKIQDYQEAIRYAISIAKVVGDGFAWIFYERESDLINVHLRSPRQMHLPPNVGRIGERAFVERFQIWEGKLVIYHGITSFLRLGDVSFFDLSQRRIANIGEIKTEHVGGDQYRLHLGFVYGGRFSPIVDVNQISAPPNDGARMNSRQRQRLSRQLRQIAEAISPDRNCVSQTKSQQGTFYFDDLDRLIEASNCRKLQWRKVGQGLIITTLRLHTSNNNTLSRRLIAKRKFHVGKKLDGAEEATRSIVDSRLADNSLLMSNLGVIGRQAPGLMAGTIPIFWWPIKSEYLRSLVFGDVLAVSLYNPAPFWERLRARGFELKIGDRGRLDSLKRRVDQRVIVINNFQWFQMLITHYLMSEDDVLSLIDSALEFPIPQGVAARVEIRPQLRIQA